MNSEKDCIAGCERDFAETKIEIEFNGFLELPLKSPVSAYGFINCPVGIAVTKTRMWLVHLPFDGGELSREDLWPQFKQFESSPPKYAVAFGFNVVRVLRLISEMKRATGTTEVDSSVMISERADYGELHINQEGGTLDLEFQETAVPNHSLIKKIDL